MTNGVWLARLLDDFFSRLLVEGKISYSGVCLRILYLRYSYKCFVFSNFFFEGGTVACS